MMQNKPKIVLTGGYASGKTTVLSRFVDKGFFTISADDVYHELLKNEDFVREISSLINVEPLTKNGKTVLDKASVSRKIFSDKQSLLKFNNFTHSRIYDEMFNLFSKANNNRIIFEIPLLFESGKEKEFDFVIIVKRNVADRIEWGVKRDNIDINSALDRIQNQIDYDKITDNTHTYIYNDGSIERLYAEVDKIIETIEEKFFR